jgi:hypothetical protein
MIGFEKPALAQDPFHIRVHDYEPLQPREWNLELHTNYVGLGSRTSEDTTASTHNQFHLSSEITAGVTPSFSLGAMLLTGRRVGNGLEYAGAKILPHWYAPGSWNLPLDLGVVAEFSFFTTPYDENSISLEIHPVLEKRIGRLVLDMNPGFERSLRGPSREGWSFQTSFRASFEASNRITPTIEYYRESSRFNHIVAGAEIRINTSVSWSVGAGFGPTPAGNRRVFTSILEFGFGRKA